MLFKYNQPNYFLQLNYFSLPHKQNYVILHIDASININCIKYDMDFIVVNTLMQSLLLYYLDKSTFM